MKDKECWGDYWGLSSDDESNEDDSKPETDGEPTQSTSKPRVLFEFIIDLTKSKTKKNKRKSTSEFGKKRKKSDTNHGKSSKKTVSDK